MLQHIFLTTFSRNGDENSCRQLDKWLNWIRARIYKKWLSTRDLVFLNKYNFYRNKITLINKIYRESFNNTVLSNSSDGKKKKNVGQYKFNNK